VNPGYAISDFVLALACVFIAARVGKKQPGVALACAAIAAAAVVGVVRFAGVAQASGAHRFLSLIGSTAALPLLAWAIAWPASKAAKSWRFASIALLVGSALGIAIVAGGGIALWGQVVPAASALVIVYGTIRWSAPRAIAGAILLVVTFALVAAKIEPADLSPLEVLHYGMSAALLLVCL